MGELNLHSLNNYIEKYNLNTFIETGTGKGTGVSYALSFPFKKVYSIEIIKELYDYCNNTYKDSRLTILNNNSIDGLDIILKSLSKDDKVLFWLDAHFPGADFHFNSYDHLKDEKRLHKPLNKEFELIWDNRKDCKDVFIIDDLRIYEDGPFELGQWELKHVYGEPNIDFVLDKVKDTHNINRDYRHQGFLILTPK